MTLFQLSKRQLSIALLLGGGTVALLLGWAWRRRQRAERRPLVELHVHLDGALDNRLLYDAAKRRPERLKKEHQEAVKACKSFEDFEALVTCCGRRSLSAMLGVFELYLPILRGQVDLIEQQAYHFVLRQAEQRIVYTEVRYSAHLLLGGGDYKNDESNGSSSNVVPDASPVVDAVTHGLRRGCRRTGVIVNQILCCLTFRPDWAMATIELAQKYAHNFPCAVVGVDIAAGEEHFDVEKLPESYHAHREAFKVARELGLKVTLHAGEVDLGEHVEQAVCEYGATRIGHGYQASRSPDIMQRMVDAKIHFEICPTSSYEAGGWTGEAAEALDWSKHPLRAVVASGARFSINSDDPSVFKTCLKDEVDIVTQKIGIPKAFVRAWTLDAIEAAFCRESEREKVKAIVLEYYRG